MDTQGDSQRRATLKAYGALLWRYLKSQRRKAALMAALLLASTALQLSVPQILRYFIDTATGGGAAELLVRAAVLYLVAAFVNQLLSAGATYVGADVGWTATNEMRRDLAEHCLHLDMSFHTARNAGEMIERVDGDVTALSNFFSQFSVRLVGAGLLLLGILTLLWLETPLAGIMLSAFTLLVLIVLGKTRSLGVPATELEREASAQHYGFIEERLAGIEDIRANGGGEHAMHRFTESVRRYYVGTRRAWLLRSVIWLSSYGLFVVGDVATLGVAIYLVSRGSVSLGTGYLIFQYMLMLRSPVEQITRQLQEFQKAAASIGRVEALFAERSQLSAPRGLAVPSGPLSVAFENVSFAYDDKPVLRNVTFQLGAGTVLGLLGRTGSGKTTLTRLLFRLYDPAAGRVRLNGTDLRDADPGALRERVGMVTQEVQLFHASVRDNLTFFGAEVADERIEAVLSELGMLEWLKGLPQGLDTVLDSGGAGLSAGEGQLLAFARVFLKDPGLVILDEPSSRLDPATERRLEEAVARLLRGRTAIIIAHRLETLRRVDEIMVMADGRVAEHGPRAALAKDEGSSFYRALQLGGLLNTFLEDEDRAVRVQRGVSP